MFDKVLMRLAYQTTCFKLEEMTRRLTEHEGTGPRAEGRWDNGEITLNIFRDFAYVSMRFYGRMFNYLSIYRVTKNVLTLSIKY